MAQELYVGIKTDMHKAKKGSQEYEEWLRKYHEKRSKKEQPKTAKDILSKKPEEDLDTIHKNNERLAEYNVIDLNDKQFKGEYNDKYVVCRAKSDLYTLEDTPESERNNEESVFKDSNPLNHKLQEGKGSGKRVSNIKQGHYFIIDAENGVVADLGETKEKAIEELRAMAMVD